MTIPPSAATIWIEDNKVHLILPSTIAEGHGHRLTFDNDLAGRARIFAILHEREHQADLRLARRGTPTQSQLPDYDPKKARKVGRPKVRVAPGVAQAAKEVMRRMGMI